MEMVAPPLQKQDVCSLLKVVLLLLTVRSMTALPESPPLSDAFRELKGTVLDLSDPTAAGILAQATVIDHSPSRGTIDCLSRCSQHVPCHLALHVRGASDVTGSCVMLATIFVDDVVGGQSPAALLAGVDSSLVRSYLLLMNPCHNGGSFESGVCLCLAAFTGVLCHLPNPAECQAPWKRVYSTDALGTASYGSPSDVKGLMSSPSNRRTLRVMVHGANSRSSKLLMEARLFYDNGAQFGVQILPVMSQTSGWDRLDVRPWKQFLLVLSNGQMHRISEDALVTLPSLLVTVTYFLRDTAASNLLYSYDSSGHALQGTLSDVIASLRRGEAIHEYSTVYADSLTSEVVGQGYREQLGWYKQPFGFVSPAYYYNFKSSMTTGQQSKHRLKATSGDFLSSDGGSEGASVYVDTCWRKATTDRLGRDPSPYPLLGDLYNGQRLRLEVDGVLWLTVLQALVSGDTVLMGAAAYLSPETSSPWSSASREVRVVASSNGTLWTCGALPTVLDPAIVAVTRTGVSLTPFVDTRRWVQVFSVAGNRTGIHGSEEALVDAVNSGDPVQVGIAFSASSTITPGDYLLVFLTSVEVTSGGHVTGQASDLSQLQNPNNCERRAFLVTSLGDVRIYDYRLRQQGNHSDAVVSRLDWFVEGYKD